MAEISRTHWAFSLGAWDWSMGNDECPFLAGTYAAACWRAGWQETDDFHRRADMTANGLVPWWHEQRAA